MAGLLCWLLLGCAFTSIYARPRLAVPEQIHLSLGREPSEMRVTWSTMSNTTDSLVLYGTSDLNQNASGSTKKFVDGGYARHTQYIHSVLLTGLRPDTLYYYQCGGPSGWSQKFHFRTVPAGSDWTPRFIMYGDLGVSNGVSLPYLKGDVQNHEYDVILHIGDIAYNMASDNAHQGDAFMNLIQPLAAYVPYMTCPGNHENAYNFSNYKNRFVMPGDESSDNLFYSFNVGPVHIISYSSEHYYYLAYGKWEQFRQFAWMENDLKEANKPENRAKRPWIITMGHRPMYCSNRDGDDCTKRESIVRAGNPALHSPGLEILFYKYGVDLALQAHEHSYERLWPIYNRTVMNGSYDQPYTNPKAPVHIITGSAGCREGTDGFIIDPAYWSAFRSSDYGYARMSVSRSLLYLEQIAVAQGDEKIDDMAIIKDRHGPYE